jgi:hypothetical protein
VDGLLRLSTAAASSPSHDPADATVFLHAATAAMASLPHSPSVVSSALRCLRSAAPLAQHLTTHGALAPVAGVATAALADHARRLPIVRDALRVLAHVAHGEPPRTLLEPALGPVCGALHVHRGDTGVVAYGIGVLQGFVRNGVSGMCVGALTPCISPVLMAMVFQVGGVVVVVGL